MIHIDDLNGGKAVIRIAGEDVEVLATDNVKETLKKLLKDKGIDSFSVFVDGDEVTNPNDLPETFENIDLEVSRNVKAGSL